jgi:hypothetical protein
VSNYTPPKVARFNWYDGEKTHYGTEEEYSAWLKGRFPKTCECGGDAVKAAFHSDYCPKYENT